MRRWLKLAAAFAVAGPFGVAALQALRAWRNANQDFDGTSIPFAAPTPIAGHEVLRLTTRGGLHIAASFVPPKNGVAVVMAHGTDTNRTQLWGDALILTGAGFGVLLFDWPGHGESEGRMTLGTPEREAFTACVDFLSARDDVKRIGAFGFSQGGGLLTAFASDEPRVSSLLAVNAWTSSVEQLRYEYRRWGPIRQLPAVAAAHRHIEGGDLRAIDAAARLQGRKTLFIASLDDEVVPPRMSSELARAAHGEVKLVPGVKHMAFREGLHGEWPRLLVDFFTPP